MSTALVSALLLGCLAARGAVEAKEHMKHYKGHVKVWAFTSVAADYDGRGLHPCTQLKSVVPIACGKRLVVTLDTSALRVR